MKHKLIVGITAVFLLVSALPAFAALNDKQKEEISQIYNQIAELRKQIVQKYVEAGELTKEQGENFLDNIDKAEKYREKNGYDSVPFGGCGGADGGMMNGGMMGSGYNMMGGYYNGNYSAQEI